MPGTSGVIVALSLPAATRVAELPEGRETSTHRSVRGCESGSLLPAPLNDTGIPTLSEEGPTTRAVGIRFTCIVLESGREFVPPDVMTRETVYSPGAFAWNVGLALPDGV